jgi:hypothetical protein
MDMNAFLPPMFGSFLGVGLGILANHYYQEYIADKNKEKYKRMIKSEIELSIKRLEKDWVQLLPIDRWTSAVNSGALKLFEVDIELEPLSRVYQRIKDYNFLATSEHFNVYPWKRLEYEDGVRLPLMTVKRFIRDKNSLLDELKELHNAGWLNPSNETAPGYNDILRYEVNERH